MNLQLRDVTVKNFFDVINLKSDKDQEKHIQIYERWVGSNTYFLALCQTYGFIPKAIYDGEQLIGFASYGLHPDTNRFEMVSLMLGHQFQGKGYGVPALKLVLDAMVEQFQCSEIYLSVIHDNVRAIATYEKLGFKPTGEVEEGNHPEPVYCLKLQEAI